MKKLTALLVLCLMLTGCGQKVVKPVQTDPPYPIPERAIPTETPTEAPTEAPAEPEDEDLVLVTDYIPGIRVALAYATEHNFTGQTIYEFTEAYLRYGTVKKLKPACEDLAQQGLGLLIWDGFRPVAAQQRLWDICPDPTFVSHPATGNRAHCRGSAVDVTLVDLETGAELEMPTGFDDFSKLADRDYSDCSGEAAKNAQLLEEVMEKYGFMPYSAEWWHFSDTDDYPVEEEFNPAGVG
ncbi:MAG: M15 family metallopeptidase [Oscillospiraceae bacterium]|nr:M15 family metallopeptidase [Oscillospiraceae bacterium]